MTPEQRIEQLEKEVAELRKAVQLINDFALLVADKLKDHNDVLCKHNDVLFMFGTKFSITLHLPSVKILVNQTIINFDTGEENPT